MFVGVATASMTRGDSSTSPSSSPRVHWSIQRRLNTSPRADGSATAVYFQSLKVACSPRVGVRGPYKRLGLLDMWVLRAWECNAFPDLS